MIQTRAILGERRGGIGERSVARAADLDFSGTRSQTYHQLEELFGRAGAVLNVGYQLENSLSMINFVAMGSGCSLLPEHVRDIHQAGVVYKRPSRSA
jgi:DNA-binding transcriptional LysR family regulator